MKAQRLQSAHHRGLTPLAVASASLLATWPRKRVLGERSRQRLFAAHLLAAYEAVNCHRNGSVNVLRRAVFRQSHSAECLANSDDSLQMTDLLPVNISLYVTQTNLHIP